MVRCALRCLPWFLFLAARASATDFWIGPSDSLQLTIDAATDGDRIFARAGTYAEQIDFRGKDLEVVGVDGPLGTVIDAGGVAPVVRFSGTEPGTTLLQGFTVTGGVSGSGPAGILVGTGGHPRIEDCIVRDNYGRWGGGVAGSPQMRRCVIRGNRASLTHGGGIYGAPSLFHCVIAENSATSANGGGLYATSGTISIEDCVFVGNAAVLAGSHGGAVFLASGANATVRRTLFVGNSSTGGVFAGYGGAVAVAAAGSLFDRCTFVENVATGSSVSGTAVYGPAVLESCVVWNNAAPALTGPTSVTYSDVEGGYSGTGNFDADPLFVDTANRELHLEALSPCIDAGDPSKQDPDGSRADVGAFLFESLYVRSNTLPEHFDDPSFAEFSARLGGGSVLRLNVGPAHAGEWALTLGTLHGTDPGIDLLGFHVPLQPDAYFRFTLSFPNSPLLQNSLTALDANGRAEVRFHWPADRRGSLAGYTFHHASLLGDPVTLTPTAVTHPTATVVVD